MGKRKIKNYTLEFKQASAKLAAESEQPVSHTAKGLGISSPTLHGWVNKYHPKQNRCPLQIRGRRKDLWPIINRPYSAQLRGLSCIEN